VRIVFQVEGIKLGNRTHKHELGILQYKENVHCKGKEVENFFASPFEPFRSSAISHFRIAIS
jgi:hypothetical protein